MDEPIVTRPQPHDPWLMWKVWGVLTGAALIGSVVGMPYILIFASEDMLPSPRWATVLFMIIFQFAPAPLAAALGLWLGEKVGLGAPVLRAWLSGEHYGRTRFWSLVGVGALAGLVAGFVLVQLSLLGTLILPPEMIESTDLVARMTPLKGLGGAFMAGVIEEMEFRLGLMTLLVWLGAKLARRSPPPAEVIWTANLLAVLPFSLLHLSNVQVIGAPITLGVVVYVLIANGSAGMVFGWLYWRRGLEAAIVAHFSLDIVLHVLLPMLAQNLQQVAG